MNSKAIIPLVLGLGVGIFAVKIFVDVLQKARGAAGAPAQTVSVLRARVNIGPTAQIEEGMLEQVDTPKSLAPDFVFTDPQEVLGRVTNQPIPKGVPIMPSLLAPEGTPPGMAARIPDGYRAVAIKIDEITGVGGWLKPGSKVDVVIVLTLKNRTQKRTGSFSKLILQNVEVLAVGQAIEHRGPKAAVTRSITLLVDPKQATKLHLAASKGTLQLIMRNPEDHSEPRGVVTTDNELLEDDPDGIQGQEEPGEESSSRLGRWFRKDPKIGLQQTDKEPEAPKVFLPAPVQLAAATPEWTVEVISGAKIYEVRFDSDKKQARRLDGTRGTPNKIKGLPTSLGGKKSSGGGLKAEKLGRWLSKEIEKDLNRSENAGGPTE